MKFSTVEEYGLRCLLQLARKGGAGSLTIAEISQAEGLTNHNIAKMMRILRRGGLVKSARGQAGGYALARPPEQIVLRDVFKVLGGSLFDPTFCDRHAGGEHLCAHTSSCSIRALLRSLQGLFDQFLDRLTLSDLVRGESEMNAYLKAERAGESRPA